MRGLVACGLVGLMVSAAAGCGSFGSDAAPATGGDAGPAEAGVEGGGNADGGSAAPFCPAHVGAALCDDFEGRTNIELYWTAESSPPDLANAPAIDDQAATSGRASAVMGVGALAASQHAASELLAVLPHTDGDVHHELQLRVDAIGAKDHVWLTRLAFGGSVSDERFKIWLYVVEGIYYIAQQGPAPAASQKLKIAAEVKVGEWTPVVMDVSFAKKTVRVKVGAVEATMPFVPEWIGGELRVNAGIDYAEGVSERTAVHVDDVLVTLP